MIAPPPRLSAGLNHCVPDAIAAGGHRHVSPLSSSHDAAAGSGGAGGEGSGEAHRAGGVVAVREHAHREPGEGKVGLEGVVVEGGEICRWDGGCQLHCFHTHNVPNPYDRNAQRSTADG